MQPPSIDTRELSRAQDAVAVKDPEHLIRFLVGSDLSYLVFHAPTLVRGLPWPTGVDALMQVIAAYNSERRLDDTGWATQSAQDAAVPVPITKDDRLFLGEIDDAIAQLQRLKNTIVRELVDRGAKPHAEW